ncbi:hypothetical protein ACOME3_009099 [Neoechinorhynchus agilis]
MAVLSYVDFYIALTDLADCCHSPFLLITHDLIKYRPPSEFQCFSGEATGRVRDHYVSMQTGGDGRLKVLLSDGPKLQRAVSAFRCGTFCCLST